jgi:hypothetical protein
MDKSELVRQLRATAAALKPLTDSVPSGAARWDGTQYASGAARKPDPYALSWWSVLSAIASLLEAQDAPISAGQLRYLKTTLLGGMGSLNDLYFDSGALGAVADSVNAALDQKRRELHACLAHP